MTGYKVGYGRPPKETQFKKGVSGNPAGRPTGARSLHTILAEELRRRVPVQENGRMKNMTKLEVFVRKRVNDGIKGGSRDAEALIRLIMSCLPVSPDAEKPEALSPQEQEILTRFLGPNRSKSDS